MAAHQMECDQCRQYFSKTPRMQKSTFLWSSRDIQSCGGRERERWGYIWKITSTKTSFSLSQYHQVATEAALLCTFPFLPAPQNKHSVHSMICITEEILRRFTHTQRSLHVCRGLHTWGIAAGCLPFLILQSRRVFFLRWCSSVRVWKCQRSHMFISSLSPTHTGGVGEALQKMVKPKRASLKRFLFILPSGRPLDGKHRKSGSTTGCLSSSCFPLTR